METEQFEFSEDPKKVFEELVKKALKENSLISNSSELTKCAKWRDTTKSALRECLKLSRFYIKN